MTPNRTEIKAQLNSFIARGGVVLATKTRAAIYGGQTHISVGRHCTAAPTNKRYAIYTDGKRPEAKRVITFGSAWEAVNWFVDFCGNNVAWEALRRSRSSV